MDSAKPRWKISAEKMFWNVAAALDSTNFIVRHSPSPSLLSILTRSTSPEMKISTSRTWPLLEARHCCDGSGSPIRCRYLYRCHSSHPGSRCYVSLDLQALQARRKNNHLGIQCRRKRVGSIFCGAFPALCFCATFRERRWYGCRIFTLLMVPFIYTVYPNQMGRAPSLILADILKISGN